MKKIICNAFSANMIDETKGSLVLFNPIPVEQAAIIAKSEEWESSLGHEDIVNVVNAQLGTSFTMNRRTDVLETGDVILLAQYKGPRLPEGATALPEGARIQYYMIIVIGPSETPDDGINEQLKEE